jgi:hypothetical protein
VWDLIVNNDDISFKHIIPRLNATDIKFLYGVNTETRKLVQRSSRKKELKKKFIVREMSSISTLEVAWENKSLWPSWWEDETWFCFKVAQTNKLELLKWAREEKKCKWNERTINAAAYQGNLEMVKLQRSVLSMRGRVQKLPETVISRYSNTYAKKPKRLGIRKLPLGRLNLVTFIYLNILLNVSMINIANGRVWMQPSSATWTVCSTYTKPPKRLGTLAPYATRKRNRTECVQYLLDSDCPLPDYWRYEEGTLYLGFR